MTSGDTLLTFKPQDNEPPQTNYARADLRNLHPILKFDQTTQQGAIFTGRMPRNYSAGTGITVSIDYTAVPTVGNIGWLVAFERVTGGQDVDADGFAADQTFTPAAVPATSGVIGTASLAVTAAAADAIVAGDVFRIRIRRDTATASNAAGDVQLHAVELKDT